MEIKTTKIFVLSLILLMVFSKIVFAAEESLISVESHVNRATITIGDRILYTLTVKTEPSLKLEPLALGSNLGAFEVKDYKIYDPVKNKDGKVINKSEYVITTFTTGEYVIPPIAVHYTDPKGEKKEIQSEPLFVLVKSVGATESDKEDIRGLKPPIEIKGGYWTYLLILPALVLLGAFGFFYYRQKSKGVGLPKVSEELKKPAWEVALLELENLKNSDLLDRKEVKKYYIILSDIIRKYLERRYQITALDRTTPEVKLELKSVKVDKEIMDSVYDFLFCCDLVKFAKYVPSKEEIEKDWNTAFTIINITKQEEIPVTPLVS
jgi:hypothetical protein